MVLSKASVVIGGDTGPMHIAASLNVKTVALMNPTSAVSDAPFTNDGIVLTADYECKNCYEVKCPKGICCMKSIDPEKVYRTVLCMI